MTEPKVEERDPESIVTCRVNFPVYKQGDDMSMALEDADGFAPDAFGRLAMQYAEAAAICHRLEVLTAIFDVRVEAYTHLVTVTGPWFALEMFVLAGDLTVEDDVQGEDEECPEDCEGCSCDEEDEGEDDLLKLEKLQ
jgi:hypothetical protein